MGNKSFLSMLEGYLFDDLEAFSEAHFEKALCLVSPARREKALRYRFPLDQKLSVMAELLLRHALGGDVPDIAEDAKRKPFFPDKPSWYFNLSHCPLCVACALSDRPVGIDVERFGAYTPEQAKAVLNAEELRSLNGVDNTAAAETFAHYWTRKESFLKYTGTGLCDHLPDVLEWATGVVFHEYSYEKGYCLTICTPQGVPESPVMHRLHLSDLM